MKTKTILAALLVAFAISAKAGNEGPQAAPVPPSADAVLAEYTTGNGFVPPGSPTSFSYQIFISGQTRLTTTIQSGQDVVTHLTPLTHDELSELVNLVYAVKPGKMYDTNPNAPQCADGGSSQHLIYRHGKKIVIGQRAACKTYKRKVSAKADRQIIEILNKLSSAPVPVTGALDGKAFCRKLDESVGQPNQPFQHCISFSNGVATDSANSFFGNPPEHADYQVNGQKVIFGTSEYELSADGTTLTTVSGSTVAGTVLTLK